MKEEYEKEAKKFQLSGLKQFQITDNEGSKKNIETEAWTERRIFEDIGLSHDTISLWTRGYLLRKKCPEANDEKGRIRDIIGKDIGVSGNT